MCDKDDCFPKLGKCEGFAYTKQRSSTLRRRDEHSEPRLGVLRQVPQE
jgi:hypothetical protein